MIQKIEAEKFGKLNNFTLELHEGFNLIYGENEAGKSTICAFLRAMFYGFPPKKSSMGIREDMRKRYMPWNETFMSGRVHFTHEGKSYVLERRIANTKSKDTVVIRDGITWEPLNSIEPDEIGKTFLGVGEDGFLKTLFIGQLSASVQKSGNDEVIAKLSNLKQSGDEDISYQKVLSNLEKAKYDLISKSKTTGELVKLQAETESLKKQLSDTKQLYEQYRDDIIKKSELEQQIAEQTEKVKTLSTQKGQARAYEQFLQAKKLQEEMESLKQRLDEAQKKLENNKIEIDDTELRLQGYQALGQLDAGIGITVTQMNEKASLIAQSLDEAEKIKQEIEKLQVNVASLESQKQTGFHRYFSLFGIVILALSILGAFVYPPIIGLAVFGIVLFILGLKSKKASNLMDTQISELNLQMEQYRRKMDTEEMRKLENELAQCQSFIQQTLTLAGANSISDLVQKMDQFGKLTSKLEQLRSANLDILQNIEQLQSDIAEKQKDFTQLGQISETDCAPITSDEADRQFQQAQNALHQLEMQLHTVKNQLDTQFSTTEDADILESIISANEEKMEKMKLSYEALCKAIEVLGDSYNTLKDEFAPMLSQITKKLLSDLSGGVYTDVKVSDDYRMMLMDSRVGEIVSGEFVSGGTYDLIYLALRLGIVKMLYGESVPLLILDDTFLQLDNNRNQTASKFLLEEQSLTQVLYFTCHTAQKELFLKENAQIHLINLAG